VRILVIGQKGNGPVLKRIATPREFFVAWGPWAPMLWTQARDKAVVVDGCKVRIALVP
jgi:hypothetical protein